MPMINTLECPLELDGLGSRFSVFVVSAGTHRVSFLPVRQAARLNFNLCAIDQASLGRPHDRRTDESSKTNLGGDR